GVSQTASWGGVVRGHIPSTETGNLDVSASDSQGEGNTRRRARCTKSSGHQSLFRRRHQSDGACFDLAYASECDRVSRPAFRRTINFSVAVIGLSNSDSSNHLYFASMATGERAQSAHAIGLEFFDVVF